MPIKCIEDLRCYVNIKYFNFSFVRCKIYCNENRRFSYLQSPVEAAVVQYCPGLVYCSTVMLTVNCSYFNYS